MVTAQSETFPPDNDDACEWVAFVGVDVAKFCRRFGGRMVYVPHSLNADHPIADAIGLEAATRLCEGLAGVQLYVPTMQRRFPTRPLLILILSWAGVQLHTIAEAAEITVRQTTRIRARLRADGFLPAARNPGNSHNLERY